jgi:hypothetical protein
MEVGTRYACYCFRCLFSKYDFHILNKSVKCKQKVTRIPQTPSIYVSHVYLFNSEGTRIESRAFSNNVLDLF